MPNVHSHHSGGLLEIRENKRLKNKTGSWKAALSSLPLGWSKIVSVSICINEKQNSSLSKSFQIYAWLQPFEVDTAEIIFFHELCTTAEQKEDHSEYDSS